MKCLGLGLGSCFAQLSTWLTPMRLRYVVFSDAARLPSST